MPSCLLPRSLPLGPALLSWRSGCFVVKLVAFIVVVVPQKAEFNLLLWTTMRTFLGFQKRKSSQPKGFSMPPVSPTNLCLSRNIYLEVAVLKIEGASFHFSVSCLDLEI